MPKEEYKIMNDDELYAAQRRVADIKARAMAWALKNVRMPWHTRLNCRLRLLLHALKGDEL